MPIANAFISWPSPPSRIWSPAMYAARPSVEPTDRSTLRMISTKVWPMATMPVMAAASIRSVRPCTDRKRLFDSEVPISTTSRATATGVSRRRRMVRAVVRCTITGGGPAASAALTRPPPGRSRRA